MYELVFDASALDFLSKLPEDTKERIFNKLVRAKENPFRYFERLSGRDDYKLRVGDYRVIADIDQRTNRIQVTLIGHRKNVYKRL